MLYMPRWRVVVLGFGFRVWLERAREKGFSRVVKIEDVVIVRCSRYGR